MAPSPAETARTLLCGRLPGSLHLAGRPAGVAITYATDCSGGVLVLATDEGDLADALDGGRTAGAVGMVSAGDVPPLPDSPHRGWARVAGRLTRLTAAAAREAVMEFADANPDPALLDVGRCASLYHMDIDRVRLDTDDRRVDIDVDAYMAAFPDPLHEVEKDLLVDLAQHHAAQVGAYLARRLDDAGTPVLRYPLPVRVDRYGFTVDAGIDRARPRWVRLDFPRPVRDRHDLAHLLHPVLFHDRTEIH